MKRKGFWILLIVVLAVAGYATYFVYTNNEAATAAAAEEDELQTSTVRQGNLTISATGAGSVVPATEIGLSFGSGGDLNELLVRVGDEVQAGDVIARIDDTAAQEALANARIQLAQAAMQTEAGATQTGVSFDDISVEQTQINLDLALADLDTLLNWVPDEDEVAQLESNLASARTSYSAALGGEAASSTNITVNGINLEQAERSLQDAQDTYNTAFDPGRDWELNDRRLGPQLEAERTGAERSLQNAQDGLAVAQANYTAAVSSTNSSSSTNAENTILSAELALQAVQAGPTEAEISAAAATVRQAELAQQQALLNREANALSLTQAEMAVAAAEAALAETVLVAPTSGTVMAVNASVGENAGTAVLVSLADLDQPLVEIFLDETDLDKVGLDFEVEVVFDALPDDVFTGHISAVDPQLTEQSGVSVIRALVQLDEASFAKPQTLPVGLNATIEVIGGRANNALLVPVEALRELSPGQFAVFIMENDEPQLHIVEVGLMDFTFAEIVSGVAAGDIVTTGIVETE